MNKKEKMGKTFEERGRHTGTYSVLENSSLMGKTPNEIRKEMEGKLDIIFKRLPSKAIEGHLPPYPGRQKARDDNMPLEPGDRIEIEGSEYAAEEFRKKYLY